MAKSALLQGFSRKKIGLSLSRLPTLLGFLAFWSSRSFELRLILESPPKAPGVRHRPLISPSSNRSISLPEPNVTILSACLPSKVPAAPGYCYSDRLSFPGFRLSVTSRKSLPSSFLTDVLPSGFRNVRCPSSGIAPFRSFGGRSALVTFVRVAFESRRRPHRSTFGSGPKAPTLLPFPPSAHVNDTATGYSVVVHHF
jgi:hypothetical protein